MDLSLSEAQQSIADLAGQIFTDKLPPSRLREIAEFLVLRRT